MKTTKIYMLAFLCLIGISCEDDLDLSPLNSVTPEDFYRNTSNFEAGLYGVYDALQQDYMFGYQTLLEGISDNAFADGHPGVDDLTSFATGNAIADVGGIIGGHYQEPYVLISRANLLLANIDNGTGISDRKRNLIRAEARALRALAYMRLVYLFGDVPLITAPLERGELLLVSRRPRSEVVEFLQDELEATVEVIGSEPAAEGRLTRQAVLGFMARINLYEARLGNTQWSVAREVINLAISEAEAAGHALEANYRDLFTQENEGNGEVVFSVKNSKDDQARDLSDRFSPIAGQLWMYAHADLVESYPFLDGVAFADSLSSSVYDQSDIYINRDPRLDVNILRPGSTFRDLVYEDETFFQGNTGGGLVRTGFMMNKFNTTDFGMTLNEGELDVPVLRFADLLLMSAEAENEVNGPGAAAYSLIDRVRNRMGLPGLTPGLTQLQFRDAVINERRLELAFEGLRWFDLITLGIAEDRINNIDEGLGRSFVSNKQELFPIPQIEIDVNPNLLPNNPGY